MAEEKSIIENIYERLYKVSKGIVYLEVSMKKDAHYTKEEVCSADSIRNKQQELDTSKVSDKVLLAAFNKLYELKSKNAYEEEIAMYERIIDLVEDEKIQKEPIDRYVKNFGLLKEQKKELNEAKKFAAEQIGNGVIEEEDVKIVEEIISIVKGEMKKEELAKMNKEIGKENPPSGSRQAAGVDPERFQEIVEQLGLKDKIHINEKGK